MWYLYLWFFFVTVYHHFPCAVLSIPTIYLCFVITMFPFCIYLLYQLIENVCGNIKYISDGFFLIRFVCGRMVLKHYLSSWVLVYIIMSAKKVSRNNWISFNFVVFESVMVENWLVYLEKKSINWSKQIYWILQYSLLWNEFLANDFVVIKRYGHKKLKHFLLQLFSFLVIHLRLKQIPSESKQIWTK